MIIITGGAGMIGSMVAWHFNAHSQRDDLVLVDRILEADQWQNYCRRDIVEYLDKDELFPWLAAQSPKGLRVDAVIHMGAISATTERDFSLLLETNIRYSQRLWEWCAANEVPYLYASSAATYGGGELGYADSHDIARADLTLHLVALCFKKLLDGTVQVGFGHAARRFSSGGRARA